MNFKLLGLTGASRTVRLLFLNNMCLLEYPPLDKIKNWSDSVATRQNSLLNRVKKTSKIQRANGANTKQAKPKGLPETAEGMKPCSQYQAVTDAEKKIQRNLEPEAKPKSKKHYLSESNEGLETSGVIKGLPIPTASPPEKEQKTMPRSSTTRRQSVQKKTPLPAIQEIRKEQLQKRRSGGDKFRLFDALSRGPGPADFRIKLRG